MDNLPSASLANAEEDIDVEEGDIGTEKGQEKMELDMQLRRAGNWSWTRDVPFDRSIKREIVITSWEELDWVRRIPGLHPVYGEGLKATDVESAKRLFSRSLISYMHPSTPNTKDIATRWQYIMSEDTDETSPTMNEETRLAYRAGMERFDRWMTAVKDLWARHKRGEVPSFYAILNQTVVYFWREGAGNDVGSVPKGAQFHGMLLHGTPGTRAQLTSYVVNFSRCFESEYADAPVRVQGKFEAQKLINFVIAQGPILSGQDDVPLLLSDYPFANGAGMMPSVSPSSEMQEVRQGEDGEQEGGDPVNVLSLIGYMTSRQVQGVCEAMRILQDGVKWKVSFVTDMRSERINLDSEGEMERRYLAKVKRLDERPEYNIFAINTE